MVNWVSYVFALQHGSNMWLSSLLSVQCCLILSISAVTMWPSNVQAASNTARSCCKTEHLPMTRISRANGNANNNDTLEQVSVGHGLPSSPLTMRDGPFQSIFDGFREREAVSVPVLALSHLIDSCLSDVFKAINIRGPDGAVSRHNGYQMEKVEAGWVILHEVKGYANSLMRLEDLKVATQLMYRFLYDWTSAGEVPEFRYAFKESLSRSPEACMGSVCYSAVMSANATRGLFISVGNYSTPLV